MNTYKTIRFSLIVFLSWMLMIAGCTSGEETSTETVPGVTDSTIVIGEWVPLTGPAAPWGALGRGADVYFKMVNEEGGINGRTIQFILKDDQYQPARTVAAVKEMVERDNVFAFTGGVGTAPGMAVMDYIVEHQVPWVGVLTGAHYWAFPEPKDNIFSGLPLYFEEAHLLTDYAVNELGKTKIAVFYQNDDYGKAGLVGTQMALEKHGIELVEAQSVELLDSDLGSQTLRLRESGAEVVILYVTPRHAANLLGEAAKLSFEPQWMASQTLSDAELMHSLTNGLWEGVIYTNFLLPPTSDDPLMQKYRAAKERYAPDERGGLFFYGGMSIADFLAEGIRRTGRDLTRASLIEALSGLDGYQNIGAPVSFDLNPRHGIRAQQIVKCLSAREIEILQDWTKADVDVETAIQRLEEGA